MLLDTEGCIVIVRQLEKNYPVRYAVRVEVATTDNILCPWLFKTFGGNLAKRTKMTTTPNGAQYQVTINKWSVASAACEQLLRAVMPWLKLKHDKAQLALKFRETVGVTGKNITEEIRVLRAAMYARMQQLRRDSRVA